MHDESALSPRLAADILHHHVEALWADPAGASVLPPLMLWGPPGVGKSAIVKQVTASLGIGLVDVRLAQREPVDMRGLPVPDGDRVRWLVASEWPREPESRGIVFFDELTAADRTLQAAAYEFILDRRLGNLYTVPDGWYIVAAGNRAQDRAVASPMSSALANRFCHLEVMADSEAWIRWATSAGLHPDVTGFLRWRPNLLFDLGGDPERGWPSPRSWERVAYELTLADRTGLSARPEMLSAILQGLVGTAAATEFAAFRALRRHGPDARAMLCHGAPIVIPERADQRYALCAALVHVLVAGPRDPAELWPRFLEIGMALTSDFAAMAVNDAMAALPWPRLPDLLDHPSMRRWTLKHGDAFVAGVSADIEPLLDLDALLAESA